MSRSYRRQYEHCGGDGEVRLHAPALKTLGAPYARILNGSPILLGRRR